MENVEGSTFYIEYDRFRISDEWSNYILTGLGQYSGTAGIWIKSLLANIPDKIET